MNTKNTLLKTLIYKIKLCFAVYFFASFVYCEENCPEERINNMPTIKMTIIDSISKRAICDADVRVNKSLTQKDDCIYYITNAGGTVLNVEISHPNYIQYSYTMVMQNISTNTCGEISPEKQIIELTPK